MNLQDMYALMLLALCIWREARGELITTKIAVAWSIRNRVKDPRWWGHDWAGVILMHDQYSSFNHGDPNATKLPLPADPSWQDSLNTAAKVFAEPPLLSDPTGGATSYFDMSLDTDPPKWSFDGSMVKTLDLGRLHFYKLAS
jgi:cell wall hydrolase